MMKRPWANKGCCATGKKYIQLQTFLTSALMEVSARLHNLGKDPTIAFELKAGSVTEAV
jgi:hypothetical protein